MNRTYILYICVFACVCDKGRIEVYIVTLS